MWAVRKLLEIVIDGLQNKSRNPQATMLTVYFGHDVPVCGSTKKNKTKNKTLTR